MMDRNLSKIFTRTTSLLLAAVLLTGVFATIGLISFNVQDAEAQSSNCFIDQVIEQSQQEISDSQVVNDGDDVGVITRSSDCSEFQAIFHRAGLPHMI
jgi:hypothetical protein